MEFSVTQFYLNPRYNFNFSHKVQGELSRVISNQVLPKSKRLSKTAWSYWLIITAEKKVKAPKISEADTGKRNRQKTMSLTLPYDRVRNAAEPVLEFCLIVFESIAQILGADYEVDLPSLAKAREQVMKKVGKDPSKYYDEE